MANNNSNIFFAALIGAAVGAGIALLLAPASGKETREKLADKLGEAKDKVKEKGEEALQKIEEVIESTKEKINSENA